MRSVQTNGMATHPLLPAPGPLLRLISLMAFHLGLVLSPLPDLLLHLFPVLLLHLAAAGAVVPGGTHRLDDLLCGKQVVGVLAVCDL